MLNKVIEGNQFAYSVNINGHILHIVLSNEAYKIAKQNNNETRDD